MYLTSSANLKKSFSIFFSLIFFLFFTFSCSNHYRVFEKETLFSLNIGQMEKEISLTLLPSSERVMRDNYINQNGLFYIANSHANKIMVFTTFGDLLTLYYNPKTNPTPVTLVHDLNSDLVANLNAFTYDFKNIGLIAVDSKNNLYVEEEVSKGRGEFDKTSGIFQNRIIARFSSSGEFLDYLGQEGIGGTPFPFIHSLHVSKGGLFTVVCRKMDSWILFFYNTMGKLVNKVIFEDAKLPVVGENIHASLENFYVDYNGNRVYLKINIFERRFGKDDGLGGVVYFKETAVWTYDLESNQFTSHFELPKKIIQNNAFKINREVLYDLIGMDKKSNFFFLAPHEEGLYELFVVSRKGRVLDRVRLPIEEKGLFYKQFYVSSDAVVSALLGYSDCVQMSQWRTDSIVRGKKD